MAASQTAMGIERYPEGLHPVQGAFVLSPFLTAHIGRAVPRKFVERACPLWFFNLNQNHKYVCKSERVLPAEAIFCINLPIEPFSRECHTPASSMQRRPYILWYMQCPIWIFEIAHFFVYERVNFSDLCVSSNA